MLLIYLFLFDLLVVIPKLVRDVFTLEERAIIQILPPASMSFATNPVIGTVHQGFIRQTDSICEVLDPYFRLAHQRTGEVLSLTGSREVRMLPNVAQGGDLTRVDNEPEALTRLERFFQERIYDADEPTFPQAVRLSTVNVDMISWAERFTGLNRLNSEVDGVTLFVRADDHTESF